MERSKASYILLLTERQGVYIYNSFAWDSDGDKSKYMGKIPKTSRTLEQLQVSPVSTTTEETRTKREPRRFHDQMSQSSDQVQIPRPERNWWETNRTIDNWHKHKKPQERILEKDEKLSLHQALVLLHTFLRSLSHVAQLNESTETSKQVHSLSRFASRKQKCKNVGPKEIPRIRYHL